MLGAVGSEEHLAAELVDAIEPPAIVVELSLRTQAAGMVADMCESGHVHHGPASSSWTVIYGRARPAVYSKLLCRYGASLYQRWRIATRHGGISSCNAHARSRGVSLPAPRRTGDDPCWRQVHQPSTTWCSEHMRSYPSCVNAPLPLRRSGTFRPRPRPTSATAAFSAFFSRVGLVGWSSTTAACSWSCAV